MQNVIGSTQHSAVSTKRGLWLLLSAGCLVLAAPIGFAAEQQAPAAAAPAASQPTAPEKPLNPEDQVRAQLDGTSWSVQLTPSSGAAGLKPQKDTITFTKRQVTSEFLTKAGYPNSNYSLTLGDDGKAVWETMQTKEGEGVAFWRGEVSGTSMRGVLSKHPLKGDPEDYGIAGQVAGAKSITVPTAAQAPTGAVQVAPTAKPAAASTAPAGAKPSAKKKKKWF